MSKTVLQQVNRIKELAVTILTYNKNALSVHDKATTIAIYNLMDDIILDRAGTKRNTLEEVVDTRLMEYSILLSKSKDSDIKRLLKLIKGGIKW